MFYKTRQPYERRKVGIGQPERRRRRRHDGRHEFVDLRERRSLQPQPEANVTKLFSFVTDDVAK
jgi:hypothetical protein